MSSDVKSCYILPQSDSGKKIYLPDNQEVIVGRNVDSEITDINCSRNQVRLVASYADKKVSVEQVGNKSCALNGFKTKEGVKMTAQHGDRLEILYGKHPFKIEFNPPPDSKKIMPDKLKKRLLSQESEDEDDAHSLKKSKFISDLDEESDISKSSKNDKTSNSVEKKVGKSSSDSAGDSNKMTDSSQSGAWEFFEKTLHVYTSEGCKGRSKIAAYDMDKTLIKTKSGLEFPRDANDWQLLYPDVPGKLKKYYEDGYKIVIFSNQNSLGTKVSVKDFKLKIERLVKKIGVPMQVFLAVGQSIYRKPRTGMWEFLCDKKNDGVPVDKENSFYVGDAAGRQADASRKKKDHSLADRLMALNLGLTFHTPEEHFLGHKKASFKAPTFNPKEASKNTVLHDPPNAQLTSDQQELVIMVGCPGSGKSHFAKKHLKNYTYVNRDTLGTWQKCVAKTDEALAQGKSVVVDNTNPDKVSRQRYIDVAKKRKIPVRCFVMALDKDHIKHNNMFRILTDPSHQTISDMLINSYFDTKSQLARRCIRFMQLLLLLFLRIYIRISIRFSKTVPSPYRKNYKPPSEDEGFAEIVRINFVPCFQSEEDRRLYEMYLLG